MEGTSGWKANRSVHQPSERVASMIRLRIPKALLDSIVRDLERPHSFAFERIGFLCCREAATASGDVLLAYRFEPINDDQYIDDDSVGACFDSSAIRFGMQLALS